LYAAGVVQEEQPDDHGGWSVVIEAPRSRLQSLYGLPDGDGGLLREALEPPPV
jgi:hypothetical protein